MNAEAVLALARMQGACEALQFLTADAGAREAGTRAHMLAYVFGCSTCKTQRELAARLGRSEARVSQYLKVIRRKFPR